MDWHRDFWHCISRYLVRGMTTMKRIMLVTSLMALCFDGTLNSSCASDTVATFNGIYEGILEIAEGSLSWCAQRSSRSVAVKDGTFSTIIPVSADNGARANLTVSGIVSGDGALSGTGSANLGPRITIEYQMTGKISGEDLAADMRSKACHVKGTLKRKP